MSTSKNRSMTRIYHAHGTAQSLDVLPPLALPIVLECIRAGVISAPELDFLANSNSGIGIGIELALPSPSGIGIELELSSFELELESELHST